MPAHSLDDSDQLRRSRAGRHEVDESHRAAVRVVLSLEDERPRTIAALDSLDLGFGRQHPAPMVERSQERGEASGRIESRKTEPVDRTVPPNEGCRLAVADQCVVFDARRHLPTKSSHCQWEWGGINRPCRCRSSFIVSERRTRCEHRSCAWQGLNQPVDSQLLVETNATYAARRNTKERLTEPSVIARARHVSKPLICGLISSTVYCGPLPMHPSATSASEAGVTSADSHRSMSAREVCETRLRDTSCESTLQLVAMPDNDPDIDLKGPPFDQLKNIQRLSKRPPRPGLHRACPPSTLCRARQAELGERAHQADLKARARLSEQSLE